MYDITSEYYDISELGTWQIKKNYLKKISKLFANAKNPILDIGAGTGKVDLEIATYLDKIRILAVEPSVVMRSAFLAKLSLECNDSIRERITLFPCDIQNYDFPEKIGGVICDGVIGHLTDDERLKLWEKLGSVMTEDAPMYIGLLDPKMKTVSPGTTLSINYVGENKYETTIKEVECLGEEQYQWVLEYNVSRENKVISCNESMMKWQFAEMDDYIRELEDYGFTGGKLSETMLVFYKKA